MSGERIQSFEAFWPYYLNEHQKPATRAWHFFGTHLALASLAATLLTGQLAMIPLVLVAGYGPAWYSHFFIEKNKPATFKYPLWSLFADFKMAYLMWARRLAPEIERHITSV